MAKHCYRKKKFSAGSIKLIDLANQVIEDYAAQGFDLTLRQLYYQMVARAVIPNKDSEYKRLGSMINDARLAGLIDWEGIVDMTRHVRRNSHWDSPQSILESAANSFALDKWADQDYRVEVWIEKDALVGVISGICEQLDVPYFSCRGYTSQSEMWGASLRLLRHMKDNQDALIIHLGDHDPSGIDMTRDIQDRLTLFYAGSAEIKRIALNMEQVEEFSPPPNPAKITDSRAATYITQFGDDSWELDALEPAFLTGLIERTVLRFRDEEKWSAKLEQENEIKEKLSRVASKWDRLK